MGSSRYDELHDRYQEIRTTKKGTRYERLAAVIFAALDRESVVIHDLDVIGEDSGVKHQIDVHIERSGERKRILVECKDFDVSGGPVGLGIVRDFYGVVDDVHPDEAWVITCNDFTRDARAYAKGKGIKLATLRLFSDADWEGRVRTIVTTVVIQNVLRDRPKLEITIDDAELRAFQSEFANAYPLGGFAPDGDRTQLHDGTETRSLGQISQALASAATPDSRVTELAEEKKCEGWVSADGVRRHPMHWYRLSIPVQYFATEIRIAAVESAAALLLTDGQGLDFVLWDTALEAYTVGDDGSIHLADEATQKRLMTTVAAVPVPPVPGMTT